MAFEDLLTTRYNDPMLQRYVRLFNRYADHIHRVTDTITVQAETVRRQVTMDLTIPEDAPGDANANHGRSLIPLMRARRGRLFDNLNVVGADGRSLSVLGQRENKVLASLVLRSEFRRSIVVGLTDVDRFDRISRVGRAISLIPIVSEPYSKLLYRRYFSDKTTLEEFGVHAGSWQALEKLARFLCERYLTTAEVSAGPLEKVVIKYSYDTHYREEPEFTDDGTTSQYMSLLRARFGQSPYSFRFRIPLAFVAQSYHFRMDAPPNSYCSRQRVLSEDIAPSNASEGTRRLKEWEPPHHVQYRKSDARYASYAHLYVHGLNKRQERFPLFARVIFYERPPGSIGTVAAISTMTSLGVVVMAAVGWWLFAADSFLSVVAGLIVALPATVAVWLQPSFDRDELLSAPLSARVGLLGSGLIAYSSALLLVIGGAIGPLGWPGHTTLVGLLAAFAVASCACSRNLIGKWRKATIRQPESP